MRREAILHGLAHLAKSLRNCASFRDAWLWQASSRSNAELARHHSGAESRFVVSRICINLRLKKYGMMIGSYMLLSSSFNPFDVLIACFLVPDRMGRRCDKACHDKPSLHVRMVPREGVATLNGRHVSCRRQLSYNPPLPPPSITISCTSFYVQLRDQASVLHSEPNAF